MCTYSTVQYSTRHSAAVVVARRPRGAECPRPPPPPSSGPPCRCCLRWSWSAVRCWRCAVGGWLGLPPQGPRPPYRPLVRARSTQGYAAGGSRWVPVQADCKRECRSFLPVTSALSAFVLKLTPAFLPAYRTGYTQGTAPFCRPHSHRTTCDDHSFDRKSL